jgi:cytosine/adenosine deaminase-related metal-dependent hydrolase
LEVGKKADLILLDLRVGTANRYAKKLATCL